MSTWHANWAEHAWSYFNPCMVQQTICSLLILHRKAEFLVIQYHRMSPYSKKTLHSFTNMVKNGRSDQSIKTVVQCWCNHASVPSSALRTICLALDINLLAWTTTKVPNTNSMYEMHVKRTTYMPTQRWHLHVLHHLWVAYTHTVLLNANAMQVIDEVAYVQHNHVPSTH